MTCDTIISKNINYAERSYPTLSRLSEWYPLSVTQLDVFGIARIELSGKSNCLQFGSDELIQSQNYFNNSFYIRNSGNSGILKDEELVNYLEFLWL